MWVSPARASSEATPYREHPAVKTSVKARQARVVYLLTQEGVTGEVTRGRQREREDG